MLVFRNIMRSLVSTIGEGGKLNYTRSGTLSRIFPKLVFFAGYVNINNFTGRISEASMGGSGGVQRPVLRVKEPKKIGVRRCTGAHARQNPLVI